MGWSCLGCCLALCHCIDELAAVIDHSNVYTEALMGDISGQPAIGGKAAGQDQPGTSAG